MTEKFQAFIESLAQVEVPENAFNLYAPGDERNGIRRNNLLLYLRQMAALKPRILLLGEAPGYQGCRLTGIPFTSEYVMLNGIEGVALLGEARGFRKTDDFERVKKEPSSTILWGCIRQLRPVPVIWGAYPFHPHKLGNPWSNRAPKTSELALGESFIQEMMALFPVEKVIAVGNKAEKSLTRLGIAHQKVRHPSQGGKQDFIAGMDAITAAMNHERG